MNKRLSFRHQRTPAPRAAALMKQTVRLIETVEQVTETELDFPLYLVRHREGGERCVDRYESPHRRLRIVSGPALLSYGHRYEIGSWEEPDLLGRRRDLKESLETSGAAEQRFLDVLRELKAVVAAIEP